MRRPFIAGNWKMNLTRAEAVALATEIASKAAAAAHVDIAICPPSVYLDAVGAAVQGSPVGLGAQNMYFESNGAFTGETSGAMLQDLQCRYVILGHSERRHILGETDQDVNRKVKVALAVERLAEILSIEFAELEVWASATESDPLQLLP